MLKKSSIYALMAGLVVLATVLAACGVPATTPAPTAPPAATQAPANTQAPAATNTPATVLNVGIVLPTKDEPRWIQDQTRFQEALTKAGYNVQILFSQGDSAKEKANVEALISQGIKVLIITPQDATAAAAAADE